MFISCFFVVLVSEMHENQSMGSACCWADQRSVDDVRNKDYNSLISIVADLLSVFAEEYVETLFVHTYMLTRKLTIDHLITLFARTVDSNYRCP